MIKSLLEILLILFGIISASFGYSAQEAKETEHLNNFIAWQKQLGWNSGNQFDYFLDNNVSNIIRPLSGQWEIWRGNAGAELRDTTWNAEANTRTSTKKIPWSYNCGEVPAVLLGEKSGSSPLYEGMTYRFGVHAGEHILKSSDFTKEKHLQIKVYDLKMPSNQKPVYVESIQIPLNKFAGDDGVKQAFTLQWDEEYLKKYGGIVGVGSNKLRSQFGLETWVEYTESRSAFGHGDGSGIILSHRANNHRYGYVVQLMNDSSQAFSSLYAMDFSPIPPESAAFILQSQFMCEPRPSGYWGVLSTNDEKIRDFGIQPLFMEESWHQKYWEKYKDKGSADTKLFNKFNVEVKPEEMDINRINRVYKKNSDNTPVSYSELDRFVSERNDPLVLAAYVQNEIELIDGVGVPETNRSPEWAKKECSKLSEAELGRAQIDYIAANTKDKNHIITPGRIKRSPFTTFLEGQGSPWEQCDLLVYMLRQAGYAAAYVESEEPFIFSRTDFSRLLRLQLEISFLGIHPDDNAFIRVRYPWVAYYDEAKNAWIHLFPWIKETKVIEGNDLYGLMPEGYKSGLAWARHYLENDPAILKHVKEDGNDTAAILFKRFVEEVANKKGISFENIGVRYQNIKKNFSNWDDFPKPICFIGEGKFFDTIGKRDNLFATVQFKLNSIQNPQKELATKIMRLADIHNRAFYISFNSNSEKAEESKHEMILRMEGLEGFSTEVKGDFNKDALYGVQEKKLLLNGSDHEIKLRIIYDQKMEGSYLDPILRSQDIQETNYTIDKGSLASICINAGRVTKEMLKFHVNRYSAMDKDGNSSDLLGRLTYLAGMSYFEKLASADKTLRDLHKINNVTGFRVGLSKLSPDLSKKSANLNAAGEFIGKPILKYPQVDMRIFEMNEYTNGSIRPDLGEEMSSVMRDYYVLRLVDGSSNEHQIINDFYGDKYAVSTVKLLQLAHKRHVDSGRTGSGFLVFTRSSLEEANKDPNLASKHYFSHIFGLNLANVLREGSVHWEAACKGLNWDSKKKIIADNNDSYYATIFMTPGEVYSADGDPKEINNQPTYRGMGTLIFTPSMSRAMISSNKAFMDGGYGSRLSENLFDSNNIPKVDILWSDNGVRMDNKENKKGNPNTFYDSYRFGNMGEAANYLDSLPKDFLTRQYIELQRISGNFANSEDFYSDCSGSYQHLDKEGWSDFLEMYKNIVENDPLKVEAQTGYKELYRTVSDPVDIVTGAFQIQAEDLILGGAFPVKFKRNYSSGNPFWSVLGYGWKPSFVPHLVLSPKQEESHKPAGEIIEAAESDGTVVLYHRVSENLWKVLQQDNQHLATSGDENYFNNIFEASIKKARKDNAEEYHLYGADGSLRIYRVKSFPLPGVERSRPYLISWQDARGNSTKFVYGENKNLNDYGQLKKIIAANGDFIELLYDKFEHLTTVRARDGRSGHYAYDQFGDLESVTLPDGTIVKYTYEHRVVKENNKQKFYSTHQITHEEKPNGRILQNIYDHKGRVIEQKTNRLIGVLTTNAKFAYIKDSSGSDKTAIREVYDAAGGLTRYKLYDSLITHIVDPLGNNIYQSWYLAKDSTGKQLYFDGERGLVQVALDGFTGFPHQLMTRIDKRKLRINYSYNENGKILKKQINGSDLSGDNKLQNLVSNYTYNNGQIAAISDANNKGIYFIYGDSKYPRLATRIEQKVGDKVIFIKECSYRTTGIAHGLLLKELSYDPNNQSTKVEVSYEYDNRGLAIKKSYKMNGGKDVVIKYEYDLQGNLAREVTDSGAYTKYLHDNMDRLIGVVTYNAKGKELSATYYHYNANGELEWIKGPANERDYTLFGYDKSGNQVSKVRWRFQIDDPKFLDQKIIPIPGYQSFVSQAIELRQYDDLGRLTHSFDPEGHVIEYTYNALCQVTGQITKEKLGGKVLAEERYEYEPGGYVSKIIHSDKSVTTRSYTTNGLMKEERHPDGTNHTWVYDAQGRVVAETTEKGANWSTSYDDVNNAVTHKEIKTGITEVRKLDSFGKVVEEIDANGSSIYYIYDNLGRLISKRQNNEITKYNHRNDEEGNELIEKVFADGTRQQQTFDAAGKLRETSWYEKDAVKPSKRTSYVYHIDGHVCEIRGNNGVKYCYFADPDGRHLVDWNFFASNEDRSKELMAGTTHDYDRVGNLLTLAICDLGISNYFYDGLRHVTKESKNWRGPISYTYDGMGRLVQRELPMKLTWRREYISPTETKESTIWDGHSIQGQRDKDDNSANLSSTTDLNGYTVAERQDVLGRVVETAITGPNNYKETTVRNYDSAGNLTKVTQKNPAGETVVERKYDSKGSILHEAVIYNEKKISSWEQEWRAGKRTSLVFKGGDTKNATWNFNNNASSLLTKLEVTTPAKHLAWEYVYDEAGLLNERHSPWQNVRLNYDIGGHLIQQQVGKLLTEELFWGTDGKVYHYRYKRENDTLKALANFKYTRGRMEVEDHLRGEEYIAQTDYYYDWDNKDGLGILTKVVNKGTIDYEHTIPEGNGYYARAELESFVGISSKRLLGLEGKGEKQQVNLKTTYDAMGRVIERHFQEYGQKQTLKWDPQGRLLNVALKNNQGTIISEWQATYDGLGRRIQTKSIPYNNGNPIESRAVTQTSLYDPEVEFLEIGIIVKVGAEQPKTIWKIYGAGNNGIYGENNGIHGGLEAVIDGDTGATYGITNNLVGDIALVTDNNNKVTWQKEIYCSYGPTEIPPINKTEKASALGDLAKAVVESSIWQGRRIDPTGFINFGARYYDPLTARFLSCDPLGHAATPDLYSYADADPINNIDPDGRFASKVYDYTGQTLSSYSLDDLERDLQGLGPLGMEVGKGAQLAGEAINALRAAKTGSTAYKWLKRGKTLERQFTKDAEKEVLRESNNVKAQEATARGQSTGNYRPDRTLPRDKYGNPVPESSEPHTQLGKQTGRSGEYTQAREFGKDGKLVKDIDFTDHGRPSAHPNPHQHRYIPNPTGGTPKRGKTEPLSYE